MIRFGGEQLADDPPRSTCFVSFQNVEWVMGKKRKNKNRELLSEEAQRFVPDSYLRLKECSTKKPYDTPSLAEVTAKHQMEKSPGTVLRTYQCRWCHKWHLTSKTNWTD